MKRKWFRANPVKDAPERVDREKGIIYGVSVNTEGPALGHGVELEREFVENVTILGNKWKTGLKSRYGHPGMSSEALGTYVGRYKNFRNIERDGKLRSIADFHVDPSTASAPGGDRGKYILDLAVSDPEAFATSIVFTAGESYKYDTAGNKVFESTKGYSRVNSKEYATIEALHANDFVDSPAANPDGLFSEDTFAGIAGQFFKKNPEIFEILSAKPELVTSLMEDEKYADIADQLFSEFPKLKELLDKKPEAVEGFMDKYNKLPTSTETVGEEVTLNKTKFKAEHPELYQEVFEEGSKFNQERVMAHIKLGKDNDAFDVAFKGIEEGVDITPSYIVEYTQAGINKQNFQSRVDEDPKVDPDAPAKTQAESLSDKKDAAMKALMAKRGHEIKEGN